MDTLIPLPSVETGDGFIVVSRTLASKVAPYTYAYSYDWYASLSDADEFYRDLLSGEYEGRDAVAILPSLRGLPLGAKVI